MVTEPAAWASDGVAQIRRTIDRIASRRGGRPVLAGVAVNRLGRTRDARYWHEQLVEHYGDDVLAPVHLRAAVAEASAQSLPVHGLGARAGAQEAAAEFDALLAAAVPGLVPTPDAALDAGSGAVADPTEPGAVLAPAVGGAPLDPVGVPPEVDGSPSGADHQLPSPLGAASAAHPTSLP